MCGKALIFLPRIHELAYPRRVRRKQNHEALIGPDLNRCRTELLGAIQDERVVLGKGSLIFDLNDQWISLTGLVSHRFDQVTKRIAVVRSTPADSGYVTERPRGDLRIEMGQLPRRSAVDVIGEQIRWRRKIVMHTDN